MGVCCSADDSVKGKLEDRKVETKDDTGPQNKLKDEEMQFVKPEVEVTVSATKKLEERGQDDMSVDAAAGAEVAEIPQKVDALGLLEI